MSRYLLKQYVKSGSVKTYGHWCEDRLIKAEARVEEIEALLERARDRLYTDDPFQDEIRAALKKKEG